MSHSVKETVAIGFCDPGMVDGKFMSSVVNAIFWGKENNMNIVNVIRTNGNQIARQRQSLFDIWADESKEDWLLWIDSDIVLNPNSLQLLWNAANKNSMPVVSGVYFISYEPEKSLMQPKPSIFKEGRTYYELENIHPLPHNKVIEIDFAGFGFLLMHKSIISKIRATSPDYSLFAEEHNVGDNFVSEDIAFFKKLKKSGIKVHAHTGAVVEHMKRFSFDINYYNVYWNALEKGLFNKK